MPRKPAVKSDYHQCGACLRYTIRLFRVSDKKCNDRQIGEKLMKCLSGTDIDVDFVAERLRSLSICEQCFSRINVFSKLYENILTVDASSEAKSYNECQLLKTPEKPSRKRLPTTPTDKRATPLKDVPSKASKSELGPPSPPPAKVKLSFALGPNPTSVARSSPDHVPVESQDIRLVLVTPAAVPVTAGDEVSGSITTQTPVTPEPEPELVAPTTQAAPEPEPVVPTQIPSGVASLSGSEESLSPPPEDKMMDFGLYFGQYGGEQSQTWMDHSEISSLKIGLAKRGYKEMAEAVVKVPHVFNLVIKHYLMRMEYELTALTQSKTSVLRQTSIEALCEQTFTEDAITELETKCPTLLDVLITVMTTVYPPYREQLKGRLMAVFGIIMATRAPFHNGFQRLLTLVASKRGLDTRGLQAFQKMGLTLSKTTRIRLMDSCAEWCKNSLDELLKTGKLPVLIGDNLDISVKPRIQTSEKTKQMYHFYASIVAMSNLSDEIKSADRQPCSVHEKDLDPANFVLNKDELRDLRRSYEVLFARILVKHFKCCHWMKDFYPRHMKHAYSEQMSQKTEVRGLPMLFHDEKKVEECVAILDETIAQLKEYMEKIEELTGFPSVPYEGDQLTRVRLQAAKLLRAMAEDALARFDPVGPFVSTLWHMKQDFLTKIYKLLWEKGQEAPRDEMTLRHFATLWKCTNVNGNVKSNFAAHEALVLQAGTHLMLSQAMEEWGMKSYDDWPACMPEQGMISHYNTKELEDMAHKLITDLLTKEASSLLLKYEYGAFSLDGHNEATFNPPREVIATRKLDEGHMKGTKIKLLAPSDPQLEPDKVLSYATMLCQTSMHMMHMNDSAHEGDMSRAVLGVKYLVPFLWRHSARSKYFIECVDYLIKTEIAGSLADRLRLKAASFVNPRGGEGHCMESDLLMEHCVRSRKDMMRRLGANKSEKAIRRVTAAADAIQSMTRNLDSALGLKPPSTRHTDKVSEKDILRGVSKIASVRPFQFQSGRVFKCAHKKTPRSLFATVDCQKFAKALQNTSWRIMRNVQLPVESDSDSDSGSQDSDAEIPDAHLF